MSLELHIAASDCGRMGVVGRGLQAVGESRAPHCQGASRVSDSRSLESREPRESRVSVRESLSGSLESVRESLSGSLESVMESRVGESRAPHCGSSLSLSQREREIGLRAVRRAPRTAPPQQEPARRARTRTDARAGGRSSDRSRAPSARSAPTPAAPHPPARATVPQLRGRPADTLRTGAGARGGMRGGARSEGARSEGAPRAEPGIARGAKGRCR